jgi:hypothetical protein
VNIDFHPRPATPSSLRNRRPGLGVILSFPSPLACPVYPACPGPRREERREHSRKVNLLSLRLLPAVDCKLSAVSNRPFNANSYRIIFFAYPHPLTPIESYSCKKQGGGVPLTPNRGRPSSCLCPTRRNPRLPRAGWERGNSSTRTNARNFNLFMGLLHNSRTPPGGVRSLRSSRHRPVGARHGVPSFFFSRPLKGGGVLYVEFLPPGGSPALRESKRELTIRKVRATAR